MTATAGQPIKVSVIIPVYGVERYIERCARSLFSQTMTDGIEFIFVDDHTPDRSIDIVHTLIPPPHPPNPHRHPCGKPRACRSPGHRPKRSPGRIRNPLRQR